MIEFEYSSWFDYPEECCCCLHFAQVLAKLGLCTRVESRAFWDPAAKPGQEETNYLTVWTRHDEQLYI